MYYKPIGKNRRFAAKNQEYKDILMDYYANTNICNGGKLLVLILYNNHEEMRLLRMLLESIMVDTIHGNNRGIRNFSQLRGRMVTMLHLIPVVYFYQISNSGFSIYYSQNVYLFLFSKLVIV